MTVFASTTLMIASPHPVHDAPPTELSAYVPHPMRGESPTLPGYLFGVPPVEVPDAITPLRSTATAPTVSCGVFFRKASFVDIFFLLFLISFHRSSSLPTRRSSFEHCAIPCSSAKRTAPCPASMICSLLSIMTRAREIG